MISELQGKTNQIQSLNSQPTFADMLINVSAVQFNQNVEKKLVAKGVKIAPSTKRRKENYNFPTVTRSQLPLADKYEYPSSFAAFQKEQQKAHEEGVKEAQTLFERYSPAAAVECLKESNSWQRPYSFDFVDGVKFVSEECPLPSNYNKLNLSFGDLVNIENVVEEQGIEDKIHDVYVAPFPSPGDLSACSDEEDDEPDDQNNVSSKSKSKWHITKLENGKLSHIHIRRALKRLLPREGISRNRGQRHTAAKYLPGHAPVDSENDLLLFSDVAVKVKVKETPCFQICKIVAIRSNDGKDLVSANSKKEKDLSVRFTLYSKMDGYYVVPSELPVSSWRPVSGILTAIESECYEG